MFGRLFLLWFLEMGFLITKHRDVRPFLEDRLVLFSGFVGFGSFLLGLVLFSGFSSFNACSEDNALAGARNRSGGVAFSRF